MASQQPPPEMTEDTPSLVAHFERALGRFRQGHRFDGFDHVQFLEFSDQPARGSVTFTTLGLSHHVLRQSSGQLVRQELLVCQYVPTRDQSLLPLLATLTSDVLASHVAPPRGHVVGPSGSIVPGSAMEAFFFTEPLYYPAELFRFVDSDPVTLITWAIPVSAQEAVFARSNGPSAFEHLLLTRDPDVLDLSRQSLL